MKSNKILALLIATCFGINAFAQDTRNPFAPKSSQGTAATASQPNLPTPPSGTLMPSPSAQGGLVNPMLRQTPGGPVIGGSVLPPPVPARTVALPQLPPPTFEAPPVPSDLAPLPGESGSSRAQKRGAESDETKAEKEPVKGDEAFKKQRSDALKLREQCKYELETPSRVELNPSAQTVLVKLKGKVVPGCARAVQSSSGWIDVVDQNGLTIELDIEPNYSGESRRGKVFIASPGLSLEVSLIQRPDPNFREIR